MSDVRPGSGQAWWIAVRPRTLPVSIGPVLVGTAVAQVEGGLAIGPAWTDDRIARGAAPLAPSVPHELRRLAAMATAMTFGDRADAWRLADDATATGRSVIDALRSERSRWQRIRWRLSLRSLRTSSRSPVVA